MTFLDILLLAVALAMDCFTVSIVSGVLLRRLRWATVLRMSFLFGFFQAAMPFLGWLLTSRFSRYIESFDHWVAFGLLMFLGVRMLLPEKKEAADSDSEATPKPRNNPARLTTQLTMAVATSIDALAVGISFACMDYRSISSLTLPLVVIGVVSFLFGVAGNLLGLRFGEPLRRRLRPELAGGVILILIGIKILLSHLCE